MIPQVLPVRYYLNPRARRDLPYSPEASAVLNTEAHRTAFREISSWDSYQRTPLRTLPDLARSLGIHTLWYKDEGTRMGLGSFKALGGSYGVFQVLREVLIREGKAPVSSTDILRGRYHTELSGVTVTCASAGNHGQAVAWGARIFGCRSRIFLPRDTAEARVEAIRRLGAEVMMVDGSYDEAVVEAARTAAEEGWHVVSDTAYMGYEEIPRHIMQGYTIMIQEALEQMPPEGPTHCFVQGGVGGLAGAVTAHLWENAPSGRRPAVIVVEPAEADCLLESALAARWAPSRGSLLTSMSCLACRKPSTLAWPILDRGADAFLTIPDYAAEETVALLAAEDPVIRTQPSGAAGVAGLVAALFEPTLSGPLGLGKNSRVLVFGSEGPREESAS